MSQTSLFVLLNASCHKKREYIWFMGGNFRGFQGNELFLSNEKDGGGGGMRRHTREGDFPISVTECVLS